LTAESAILPILPVPDLAIGHRAQALGGDVRRVGSAGIVPDRAADSDGANLSLVDVDELPDRGVKPSSLEQSEATRFTAAARVVVSSVGGDEPRKRAVEDAKLVR
jgi:hypothetical protein